MLKRTAAALLSDPAVLCDDSGFAFGAGANDRGAVSVDAVRAFFGEEFRAPTISGNGTIDLRVPDGALQEIDRGEARSQIVQLLETDFRMFSGRIVEPAALRTIAATFLEEIGDCKFYSNTGRLESDGRGGSYQPYRPVTSHSRDMLICAVSSTRVAYWAHANDE